MFSRVRLFPLRFLPFFVLIFNVSLSPACSPNKAPSKDKIHAMMSAFFSVPVQAPSVPNGIWVVEPASVSALIEKKFLSVYEAKPDEMKAQEIRERLKSLNVFFRIEGNNLAMLSIVSDSFGISSGSLKRRPSGKPGDQIYDAVMRGKEGTVKSIVKYRILKDSERLEYEENGLVMTALREKRSAVDLTAIYSRQIKAGTGLTQY